MVFGSEKKQRLAEEKRELMNNINAEKTKAKLEEARDDLIDKIEEIETLQRKNEELIIENRNLRERIKQMEEEKTNCLANKNKKIDFENVITEGERCIVFGFEGDGRNKARKNYDETTTLTKNKKLKVLSDVYHFLSTGDVVSEFLNDFYRHNSKDVSTSKALVSVKDTASLVALCRLSFNQMETIRQGLLELKMNLFPGVKMITKFFMDHSYETNYEPVTFKSNETDCVAFVRTDFKRFLVQRCEALLKARNLKIRDRTISISITGDRGKGKSRVGLCIGLVKDTNSPLNFSVVALFDEKDSCENLLQIVPSIFRELTMIETLNVAGNEFQVVFYAVVDFMFLSALSGHQDPVCTHSCLRCTIRMRNVKCKDYFNLVSTSRVRGEASDELSKVSQDFLKIVLPENILIAPLHLSMRVFALIREVLVNNLTDEEKQVLEDNFFDLSTPVALYWQIS